MLFFFSATGNTLWAARQVAEATGERLVNMADHRHDAEVTFALDEGERVGFCFPVHGWRPPIIVREFVAKLRIDARGHYVYALCTAGDTIGETMDIFAADLAARGMGIDAAFSLLMPESYVGLPLMNVDTPEAEQRKIATAAARLADYGKAIAARETPHAKLDRGRWPRINSRLIGRVFVDHLITDKPFRVDEDCCVRCGICMRSCPVDNIVWERGGMPQWRHDGSCITCFACYHHCPQQAIAFGRRTRGKGQYYFGHNGHGDKNAK